MGVKRKPTKKTASKRPRPKLQTWDPEPGSPAAALKTTLFIPEDRLQEGMPGLPDDRPLLLTHRLLEELLESDLKRAKVLLLLREKLLSQGTIFEVDLADLISSGGVRQLVLTWTDEGWEVQVLPLWKHEFMTLVSLRKEKRHYLDIDRLINTITKHGPMPPTILIGRGQS